MPYLLDVFYLISLLLTSPWLIYKALTTGKYRRGLWCKLFGHVPHSALGTQYSALGTQDPAGQPLAWFHGVSVGEIHLLCPVLARFRQVHPDWNCVISATTDTGFDEARKRFTDLPIIYWPFDFSWAVNRVLRSVNPRTVVLAEGEIWPNFLIAAKRQSIPVAIINGRMSPRSFRRYSCLAPLVRRLFARIDLVAAQTQEYASNFRALGARPERVVVTGSVKYDGVTGDRRNPKTLELARLLAVQEGDLIWIAGSTQAPEEEIALDIFQRAKVKHPNLRLFLVPRQKERFEEVASLLRRLGQRFSRRSELHEPLADRTAVILMDTIGELGALWGLADVAFVGGSLDGHRGGQNMIEPAAYGAAVIFGSHVWNFRETAARLVEARAAIQVADPTELSTAVQRLLRDEQERRRMGTAAQRLVRSQQGATERTVECLARMVIPEGPREQAA